MRIFRSIFQGYCSSQYCFICRINLYICNTITCLELNIILCIWNCIVNFSSSTYAPRYCFCNFCNCYK